MIMVSARSGFLAGLRLAFLVGVCATLTVGIAQWWCRQLANLRCRNALESLEHRSSAYLRGFAALVQKRGDPVSEWNQALAEINRSGILPDGFSIILGEIVQEPGVLPRGRVIERYPAKPDSVWQDLKDPLSIPGLAAVHARSRSARQPGEPMQMPSWPPFENPWILEALWPLEWISLPIPTRKAGTNESQKFLLLTCRPDSIEFGARWATPGNLGLAAAVDPGAQPSNPDRDRMAISIHAVRWFGVPRSFVVVDQGLRPCTREQTEILAAVKRATVAWLP